MRLARRSGSLGPARSGDQPEGSNKLNRLVVPAVWLQLATFAPALNESPTRTLS